MRRSLPSRLGSHLGRAAFACALACTIGVPVVEARAHEGMIIVPPASLPQAARQAGESLLLVNSPDEPTLLYVEQNAGHTLTVLDVTDPGHVTIKSSHALDAPGPFEFVSLVGTRTALVRFRQHGDEAILDFTGRGAPQLRKLAGVQLRSDLRRLGNDGFIGRSGVAADAPAALDFQVVETNRPTEVGRVIDVHNVRTEVTNEATGTIFLLTGDGLYLVRRPALEVRTPRRVLDRDSLG